MYARYVKSDGYWRGMAGQWSVWARRRAILLYHVVHFSALVPLLAEAGERALITVFVRILQAVNVNAAASAAEKVSYETMVVLRVRGPGVVLRCVALCCVVLHCGVLHCVMLRRFRLCVSILVLTRVVRSPNSNLQSPSRTSPTSSVIVRYVCCRNTRPRNTLRLVLTRVANPPAHSLVSSQSSRHSCRRAVPSRSR